MSCEKPSEPEISTASLWVSFEAWPILTMIVHRLAELLLGQLHLAGEVVQVAHERRHDLAEARVGRALEFREHGFGDVFFGFDDHAAYRSMSGQGALRPKGRRHSNKEWRKSQPCCAAAFARRQAGHRQSSAAEAGIGRR